MQYCAKGRMLREIIVPCTACSTCMAASERSLPQLLPGTAARRPPRADPCWSDRHYSDSELTDSGGRELIKWKKKKRARAEIPTPSADLPCLKGEWIDRPQLGMQVDAGGPANLRGPPAKNTLVGTCNWAQAKKPAKSNGLTQEACKVWTNLQTPAPICIHPLRCTISGPSALSLSFLRLPHCR